MIERSSIIWGVMDSFTYILGLSALQARVSRAALAVMIDPLISGVKPVCLDKKCNYSEGSGFLLSS